MGATVMVALSTYALDAKRPCSDSPTYSVGKKPCVCGYGVLHLHTFADLTVMSFLSFRLSTTVLYRYPLLLRTFHPCVLRKSFNSPSFPMTTLRVRVPLPTLLRLPATSESNFFNHSNQSGLHNLFEFRVSSVSSLRSCSFSHVFSLQPSDPRSSLSSKRNSSPSVINLPLNGVERERDDEERGSFS